MCSVPNLVSQHETFLQHVYKYSESINIQDKEYYQGNRETYCKDEIDGKSRWHDDFKYACT